MVHLWEISHTTTLPIPANPCQSLPIPASSIREFRLCTEGWKVKLLTSIDDGFGQALCIFRLRPAQHAQGGSRARRAPGVRRLARGRRRVLWRLWRRWKMAAAWWPQASGRAEMNWDQHAGRMIQLPFPQTNKLLLVNLNSLNSTSWSSARFFCDSIPHCRQILIPKSYVYCILIFYW